MTRASQWTQRLIGIATLTLLLVGSASFTSPAWSDDAAAENDRPNIIFVFLDDHASHAISAYGSRINETPNIDRLAEQGMLFRNAFVTNSICAPSRAVLLTGLHSHLNGQLTNRETFDGEQRTFPKMLQAAGYNTAMIGKWHLRSQPTGFDHWSVLPGQGNYYNPDFINPDGRERITGYVTDIITDKSIEWLENGRDPDRPFLLMYHHKAPHREWMPGPDHLMLYDGEEIPEPRTLFDDYETRGTAAREQEMEIGRHMFLSYDLKVPPIEGDSEADHRMWGANDYHRMNEEQRAAWDAAYGPRNEAFREANLEGDDLVRWKYQRYVKDYLRTIASVDDNLGRMMDYLEQSGLDENTIVVYASDQGFYLGDHGWYDKRFIYEESLRTPLIIRWPGVTEPGSESEDLVSNLDWAPTLLDMAGVEVPEDMQGRALTPLLRGETPDDWRESIYYHYYEFPAVHMVNRHYGVRTDRYKLAYFYQLDEWELYDLRYDEDEVENVYDDPEYADVREALKAELTRLQEQYGEETPHAPVNEIVQRRWFDRLAEVELQQAVAYDEGARQERTDLDPSFKPLTFGAHATPRGDGVVLAQGGASHGYALYLENGVPKLALRSNDQLYEVAAPETVPIGETVHLVGMLDADLQLHLYVNGERVASGQGAMITMKPHDRFDIGADTGSPVTAHQPPFEFEGELRDIRVYWGALAEDALQAWAEQ